MIGQIIFDSGGLGANRNVSRKYGMKLAISYVITLATRGTQMGELVEIGANTPKFNLYRSRNLH